MHEAHVAARHQPYPACHLRRSGLFGDPGLAGKTALGVALSPEGTRVTHLRAEDDNAQVLDLWVADVAGGEPYRLLEARALSAGDVPFASAQRKSSSG